MFGLIQEAPINGTWEVKDSEGPVVSRKGCKKEGLWDLITGKKKRGGKTKKEEGRVFQARAGCEGKVGLVRGAQSGSAGPLRRARDASAAGGRGGGAESSLRGPASPCLCGRNLVHAEDNSAK